MMDDDVQGSTREEIRAVVIPRMAEHGGYPGNAVTVRLRWVCPICGQKRGEPFTYLSYDGSRRLPASSWVNPCGHTDHYAAVREEAATNGLNEGLGVIELSAKPRSIESESGLSDLIDAVKRLDKYLDAAGYPASKRARC